MTKILVVDDDPDICNLITLKLRSVGHDVVAEHDGARGLAAARSEAPDLVVLDWMMPHLTGLEVCEQIRADEMLAGVPVILLTAKAQDSDVERGYSAGADAYLVKPFSPRDLAARVDELLSRPVG